MCSPSLAPTQPRELPYSLTVSQRNREEAHGFSRGRNPTTAGWGGEKRWTLQQAEGAVHLLQGPMVPTTASNFRHRIFFDSVQGKLGGRPHGDQQEADRCHDSEHRREPTRSVVRGGQASDVSVRASSHVVPSEAPPRRSISTRGSSRSIRDRTCPARFAEISRSAATCRLFTNGVPSARRSRR